MREWGGNSDAFTEATRGSFGQDYSREMEVFFESYRRVTAMSVPALLSAEKP